jgi:hypothetical protein
LPQDDEQYPAFQHLQITFEFHNLFLLDNLLSEKIDEHYQGNNSQDNPDHQLPIALAGAGQTDANKNHGQPKGAQEHTSSELHPQRAAFLFRQPVIVAKRCEHNGQTQDPKTTEYDRLPVDHYGKYSTGKIALTEK